MQFIKSFGTKLTLLVICLIFQHWLHDNLPNSILTNAILPNTNIHNALWSFRSIIRFQICSRFYKDDLKYLCGQYDPMFGCDSFWIFSVVPPPPPQY